MICLPKLNQVHENCPACSTVNTAQVDQTASSFLYKLNEDEKKKQLTTVRMSFKTNPCAYRFTKA